MANNKKYLDQEGLEHLSEYIKNRLEIVDEMPESPAGDAIVFYVGEDTEDYKKGNIYQYDETDTEWKLLTSGQEIIHVDAAPSANIEDKIYEVDGGVIGGFYNFTVADNDADNYASLDAIPFLQKETGFSTQYVPLEDAEVKDGISNKLISKIVVSSGAIQVTYEDATQISYLVRDFISLSSNGINQGIYLGNETEQTLNDLTKEIVHVNTLPSTSSIEDKIYVYSNHPSKDVVIEAPMDGYYEVLAEALVEDPNPPSGMYNCYLTKPNYVVRCEGYSFKSFRNRDDSTYGIILECLDNEDTIHYYGGQTAPFTFTIIEKTLKTDYYIGNSLNQTLKKIGGEGTSIILNGVDKTAEVANFYAPEGYGAEGRVPVAHGENEAPTWEAFSGYGPSIVEDSLIFSYGLMPEVEDTSMVFDLDS